MSIALILATQLNPLLLRRYRPVQILTAAVGIALVGGLALLSTAMTGAGGLAGFLIPIAVILASLGMSFPNAPAAALTRHGATAGTAAAMLGASQFIAGGLAGPLVGMFENGTPVPLAVIIIAAAGLAGMLLLLNRKGLRTV